jgi:Do/DeqQ family serine protease
MRKKVFFPMTLVLTALIIGIAIWSNLNFPSTAHTQEAKISKEAVDILSRVGEAMAEVASAVKPAIVNISTTHSVKVQGMPEPFLNDPFFRKFFGEEFRHLEKPREQKRTSLGSGVIVDRDGYILTNYHVIKDADTIKVKLSDKREFPGKVIGADAKTDLAVIKINSNHLPVLRWGDSDKLKVGETVIAVGNPFALSQTVTSGIVSATGRANVGIADYEDFIQTDAAINPGNSGGALVNVRGELVGINTAIFSTSGGYQGIGFAIPSSMAKVVMDSLVKKGKVVRGWLGVSIQPITPELAKQFNVKEENGALVADVVEDGPAEKAGIQRGDVIVDYDGKAVVDPGTLRNMVAATSPGKDVSLKVVRDGKPRTIKVVISELPASMQKVSGAYDNLLNGIQVQDLSPDMRRQLGIPQRISGVIITDIAEGSPSEGILAKNDLIMEINRQKVRNTKEYGTVAGKIKKDEDILLLVMREGSIIYITLQGNK